MLFSFFAENKGNFFCSCCIQNNCLSNHSSMYRFTKNSGTLHTLMHRQDKGGFGGFNRRDSGEALETVMVFEKRVGNNNILRRDDVLVWTLRGQLYFSMVTERRSSLILNTPSASAELRIVVSMCLQRWREPEARNSSFERMDGSATAVGKKATTLLGRWEQSDLPKK